MHLYNAVMLSAFLLTVDNEDLNGELDDVGHSSKNGLISNEFQQALSTHFDSTSHRDNNKDIGKSHSFVQLIDSTCNQSKHVVHYCFLQHLLPNFFVHLVVFLVLRWVLPQKAVHS